MSDDKCVDFSNISQPKESANPQKFEPVWTGLENRAKSKRALVILAIVVIIAAINIAYLYVGKSNKGGESLQPSQIEAPVNYQLAPGETFKPPYP